MYSDEVANRAEQLYKNTDDNFETTQVIKFNFSNYPNPFNPSTNIVFSLEKDAFIKLKVYDILGREVANLINDYKEKGNYSYTFNGSSLSSGIYLAWLEINNELYTNKIILNK